MNDYPKSTQIFTANKSRRWLLILFSFLLVSVGLNLTLFITGNISLHQRIKNNIKLLEPVLWEKNRGNSIQVKTFRYSYFLLNTEGMTVSDKNGEPYEGDRKYEFARTLNVDDSVAVLMDPWVNMSTKFLNQYFGNVYKTHVYPLVKKLIAKGFRVIILTNQCTATLMHTCQIPPDLQTLVNENKIQLIYHQEIDAKSFSRALKNSNIKNILYFGFASNMCVIARPAGMIEMKNKGFNLYFVPEASAAIELPNTWKTGEVHKNTTYFIAQWIAEIIENGELFK